MYGDATANAVIAGDLTIDLRLRSVSEKGKRVHLTKGQFDLLMELLLRKGEIVPFERLHCVGCAVSHWNGDTRAIRQQLSKLTRAVGSVAPFIRNVRGVGYAMVLD
jgi:DNA-binding response OmpR family regulator